jgi:hypothetical protein
MTSFIALYRGETVIGARLVAVSADPQLVREFGARLAADGPESDEDPKPSLHLVGQDQEDEDQRPMKKGRRTRPGQATPQSRKKEDV